MRLVRFCNSYAADACLTCSIQSLHELILLQVACPNLLIDDHVLHMQGFTYTACKAVE